MRQEVVTVEIDKDNTTVRLKLEKVFDVNLSYSEVHKFLQSHIESLNEILELQILHMLKRP